MRPIGYYVHHHGSGHLQRFTKIRAKCDDEVVPISELAIQDGIQLGGDVPPHPRDPTAGGALHWAPIDDGGSVARRSQTFGAWISDRRPRGVVIDVSVEMALLCRLFGTATVVVRQHGDRTDAAHEMAYRSARRLLAPFPPELEHPATRAWIVAKTAYSGFVMDDRPAAASVAGPVPDADDVVVLWGSGGGCFASDDLDALIAVAAPHRVWCIGRFDEIVADREALVVCGWIDDVGAMLIHRPTVVASAGNNTVADVARAGSPLVVVPQDRPFDEQRRHAESLDAAGVAAVISSHSRASAWTEALELARRRRHALAALAERDGAAHAAQIIVSTFARSSG